jgi:hypothetical protein
LRETALFRIFAYTNLSSDDFLTFARENGLLGLPCHLNEGAAPKSPACDGPLDLTRAEAISTWEEKILWLRRLIDHWDALQSQKASELTQGWPWEDLESVINSLRGENPDDSSGIGTWLWQQMEAEDHLALHRYYVAERLMSEVNSKFHSRFVWDLSETQPMPQIQLELDSLWVGLCLQFLFSIREGTEYGRCRLCGRWFELSAAERRSHKTTCSGACRTRLFRKRQGMAYEMNQRGITPREIATELEMNVKTVRRWLQRKGK